jgi:ATP-dependent DNA ligase
VPQDIVWSCATPSGGDAWLREIEHDGHRLLAVVAEPGSLQLFSRNCHDPTPLFRKPFRALTEAGLPAMGLDGEIAVADERGVTISTR